MKNLILQTTSVNPYHNLALEQILYAYSCENIILYLWKNHNTIVVGRNQNVWKECNISAIQSDGIHLARRNSGGGAVFHDIGNLNFTFIIPKRLFNIKRQLSVIQNSLCNLGVNVFPSGRNDLILQNGKKISGNAYQKGSCNCIHHGTLLINANLKMLESYLTPSKLKLESNAVSSVHARVANLNSINSEINSDTVKNAIINSFIKEYGNAEQIDETFFEKKQQFNKLKSLYSSWDWIYGESFPMDVSLKNRFSWGEIELNFGIHKGVISNIQIYTDCINTDLPQILTSKLVGCRFSWDAIAETLTDFSFPELTDISLWLKSAEI